MTTEAAAIIWRPTPEIAERSRIGRFMRAHGITALGELHRRSVADPAWYWEAAVRDLGVRWTTPYARVLDESRGVQWPTWFPGGRLNLADNCLDRHLDAGREAQPAVVWEADDGRSRTLTYGELGTEVNRLASALRGLGVGEGDRVGIFLPMSPEAAIATLAVARIGAIYTPCFSGFGAGAVASRLSDCEATLVITADGFHRRGQLVRLKETTDEAVAQCPSVKTVLVHRRLGREIPWTRGRDRWWHEAVAGHGDRVPALPVEADHPCLIIYTSGTTGRPKGAVLTHGGFLVKTAHDFAYCMDVGERRPALLAHRPRLAHGPDGAHRRPVPRRHRGRVRGRAGPSEARSAVEPRGAAPHQRDGHLAHRRPRAHGPWPRARAAPTICRRSASSDPRASRGIRSRIAGSSSTWARRGSRSSTTRAAPRSPAGSWDASRTRRSRRARSRARSPAWRPSASARTGSPCAGRSGSWSSRGRGRA